jgi:hypothetical protein
MKIARCASLSAIVLPERGLPVNGRNDKIRVFLPSSFGFFSDNLAEFLKALSGAAWKFSERFRRRYMPRFILTIFLASVCIIRSVVAMSVPGGVTF